MNPIANLQSTAEWHSTPKTKPENVHILYFDAELDGSGGWIRCNAKIQLSKRMYGWGETKGTLLAEIIEDGVQAISGLWVLKRFLGQQAPDVEMGVVRRQAIAAQWAAGFQGTSEAADAPFLKMVLVQLIQRKGKPLARLEELVDGHYERFGMKTKRHLISREEMEMLNSFEAFVYHQSQQRIVVSSVQKVGDRWTEPVFHSKDQSVGGQSDKGEQGVADWLQEFSAPTEPYSIMEDDPSIAVRVGLSTALPMLNNHGGQTFIGDLTDDVADSSPDQSLEVDGLQMSSQMFASHFSSQRRAASPMPGSSPRPLSARSNDDIAAAQLEILSGDEGQSENAGEIPMLHLSGNGRTAYVSAMDCLTQSPRPLGDDARAALDLHLSNRDIWESRKTASIHNSWAGLNVNSLHGSHSGWKPPVHSSVHSSIDGKAPAMHASGSSGAFTPHNIHTSSSSGKPKPLSTLKDNRTPDAAIVPSAGPKTKLPSAVCQESDARWALGMRATTAGTVCDLESVLTIRNASATVADCVRDGGGAYDVIVLAGPDGSQRAISCGDVVAALLSGRVGANDAVSSVGLAALPVVRADAPLTACADMLQRSAATTIAVVRDHPPLASDQHTIVGVIGTRHLIRAMAPSPPPRGQSPPALSTPRSPIISALLNSADSNPRDPDPPSCQSLPPHATQDRAMPPLPPPPEALSLPPQRPPPVSPQRAGPAAVQSWSLEQWQRSVWTQGVTLLLIVLDLVLVLLIAPAGSRWSDDAYGPWHSASALILGIALIPEAVARGVGYRHQRQAQATHAGSFPALAASVSSVHGRVLLNIAEWYDLVVLLFVVVLFASLSSDALHPRSSAGGAFFAVARGLRVLRAIPLVLEVRLARAGAATRGARMQKEARQRGGSRKQPVPHSEGQVALDHVEEGRGRQDAGKAVGVNREAGRGATESSANAETSVGGVDVTSMSIPVEDGADRSNAAQSMSTMPSPSSSQAPDMESVLSPEALELTGSRTPAQNDASRRDFSVDDDEALPAPTNNYARGTPAKAQPSPLTSSGRPMPGVGAPALSPSLTASLRGASPSCVPPHIIVSGSLVNDHHPSTALTEGSEGKDWMVGQRQANAATARNTQAPAGGGEASGMVRPPLYPSQAAKPRPARNSNSKEAERRTSSGRDGNRIGFVSLFPDPR